MNNPQALKVLADSSIDVYTRREAVHAFTPSLRQWRTAWKLAKAFGHWWAQPYKTAPGSNTTIGTVYVAACGYDEMGGVEPEVNAAGNLTHTTATGRVEWSVRPDGGCTIAIVRKGGRTCVTLRLSDGGALTASFVPELARGRHWAMALMVVNVLGGDAGMDYLKSVMPRIYEKAFKAGDVEAARAAVAAIHAKVAETSTVMAAYASIESAEARALKERTEEASEGAYEARSAYWDAIHEAQEALGLPAARAALEAAEVVQFKAVDVADAEVDRVFGTPAALESAPKIPTPAYKPARRPRHVRLSA